MLALVMNITSHNKLPFGKHKGIKLRDLPTSYLEWMSRKLRDTDLHDWSVAAESELATRQDDNSDSLEEQANEFLKKHGIDPNSI